MNNDQEFVALLGTKGGPAVRPGSTMPTSSLISLGGQQIVVDCGLGVTRGLLDQQVDLRSLKTVIITHLHSDHRCRPCLSRRNKATGRAAECCEARHPDV